MRKPGSNIYLIYNENYINQDIYVNKRSNDDFMFCVANERIEEIIEFARHNFKVISTLEIKDFDFSEDDIVFVRSTITEQIKNKIKNTKLYNKDDSEKYKNVEYWWKFIPPKNRNFIKFKLSEIYDKSINELKRPDLKELLTKPVFIKTVKKQPILRASHWMGNDYLDAFEYDIERVNLNEELTATPLIQKRSDEYRCWILNTKDCKKF